MHKGPCIATKNGKEIIECVNCGFTHLMPIPSENELDQYYRKQYYKLASQGSRAPDLRKQLTDNNEAVNDALWLDNTLHEDVFFFSEMFAAENRSILDVGCGNGNLLSFMAKKGWHSVGIEPSADVLIDDPNISVFPMTFNEFSGAHPNMRFGSVSLINVLEHVRDPKGLLKNIKSLMEEKGIILVKVPNDFTEFQRLAEKKTGIPEWWVCIPDHINYFRKDTLESLLSISGFEVVFSGADFPMELFLLMGETYLGNRSVGKKCHNKRMSIDLAMPPDFRRKFGESMASCGMGRNLFIVARKI